MVSLNTNRIAMQALQALNATHAQSGKIQSRLSTGLNVSSTKDDSAAFVIAQKLRGDTLSWQATSQSLARDRSILDVANTGIDQISDLMGALRGKALLLQDDSNEKYKAAIRADMKALMAQIDQVAKNAEFNGVNLLRGQPGIEIDAALSYVTPWTELEKSGFAQRVAALPEGSAIDGFSISRYLFPSSPLTPSSYASAITPGGGTTPATRSLDAGDTPGTINLLLAIPPVSDAVEIWQKNTVVDSNGIPQIISTRVAATGQAYVADGAQVAQGTPAPSSPTILSFDYDPSRGKNLEFRFNTGGTSDHWYPVDIELTNLHEPITTYITEYQAGTNVRSSGVSLDPYKGVYNPEELNNTNFTENYPINNSRTFTVPGGTLPGRVDVTFDTFDIPDTMEIWQHGARIAATGRNYVAGGAPVDAAQEVSGLNIVSFDYDPAKGPLTVEMNKGGADRESAWAISTMNLVPTSTTLPTPDNSNYYGGTYSRSSTRTSVRYEMTISPDMSIKPIFSRDMTSTGLGFDNLDWNDPQSIVGAISNAEAKVSRASQYLGSQYRYFDMLGAHASKMVDTLTAATGNIVDADLSKEAALLQAAQVKEQLGLQALSIANSNPQMILALFKT